MRSRRAKNGAGSAQLDLSPGKAGAYSARGREDFHKRGGALGESRRIFYEGQECFHKRGGALGESGGER